VQNVRRALDILIRNGLVVDGTGNPWFRADVGIDGGRIAKVGRLGSAGAETVLDAGGLLVAPGFIDMHSHSDLALTVNPRAESKIRQGVTTEVIGNCGFSAAPAGRDYAEYLRKYVGPLLGVVDIDLEWETFGEYLNRLEGRTAVNVAPLVGHGAVRINTMGFEDRPPTADEMAEMKAFVARAMDEGAQGLSSGLIYPPGCYADTQELIELCRVVAGHGGIYASHIRGEGATLLKALGEAIEIGERAGLPVEVSHHKATGRENWGRVERTLEMMAEARSRGVDITCDQYPYVAGSTGLGSLLPAWAHEGGRERLLERIRDPKTREDIKRAMRGGSFGVDSPGWDSILISTCPRNRDLEGKNLAEIAGARRADPYETVFDILLEGEGAASMIVFSMCEEDVRRVMRSPLTMVGTDGTAAAPYGPLGLGKPHPRWYGTFPRILGRYVREEGVLSLEEAVRKMTSLPAQKLGLHDRGLIREGMHADITVFDPTEVSDRATFAQPHQYPQGIEYVFVNGRVVVERGEHTGALPGRVLRRAD